MVGDLDITLSAAIWECAPDAMLLVDRSGRIARVNQAVIDLFGYTRAELVGQPVELLIPRRARTAHVDKRASYQHNPHNRQMGTPMSALAGETKDGQEIAVEVALSPLVHGDQRFTIAIVRDVRTRRELEEKLRYASSHDALTGLFNRSYLEEELDRLAKGRRFPVAIIGIDIDGLKPVNDGQGHAFGDQLLMNAAKLFRSAARGDDVVARIGGDEFMIVLPQTTQETAEKVLQRLQRTTDRHNADTQGPLVFFSAGVGLAAEPSVIAAAMREADDRLYADKRRKRT